MNGWMKEMQFPPTSPNLSGKYYSITVLKCHFRLKLFAYLLVFSKQGWLTLSHIGAQYAHPHNGGNKNTSVHI